MILKNNLFNKIIILIILYTLYSDFEVIIASILKIENKTRKDQYIIQLWTKYKIKQLIS